MYVSKMAGVWREKGREGGRGRKSRNRGLIPRNPNISLLPPLNLYIPSPIFILNSLLSINLPKSNSKLPELDSEEVRYVDIY